MCTSADTYVFFNEILLKWWNNMFNRNEMTLPSSLDSLAERLKSKRISEGLTQKVWSR